MGLFKEFLGGFAEGYIQERGIEGSIEDIAGIAKGVKNFFSNSNNDEVSVVDKFYEYYNGGHYAAAQKFVKDFYRENSLQRDYVFYYLMAAGRSCEGYLENNMDMLNEATSNLNKAKTMISSYEDDYQHLLDLETEIEGYRADVIKANEGTSNWESIVEDIEKNIEHHRFEKAIQLVVDHYNRFEDKRDYWYYEWRAYIYLNQMEYESLENPSADMSCLIGLFRSELANARLSDGARNNIDTTRKLEERFETWKVELAACREWDKCINEVLQAIDNKDFGTALSVLHSHYRDEAKDKFFWYYEAKIYLLQGFSKDSENLKENLDFKETSLASANNAIGEYMYITNQDDAKSRQELQDLSAFLKDITIDLRSKIMSDEGHFDAARKLLEDHFKVRDYNFYQPMARNESKRVEFEASKANPDMDVLKKMIDEADAYISLAVSTAPSQEIKDEIMKVTGGRVNDAKKILKQNTQTATTIVDKKSTSSETSTPSFNVAEQEYAEEIKACLEDGEISTKERRLLNKLRLSLGISDLRALEIEALCNPNTLTSEEQEYADEIQACLEDDGGITDKERRLLNRLAKSLGISSERAIQIEEMIVKNNV